MKILSLVKLPPSRWHSFLQKHRTVELNTADPADDPFRFAPDCNIVFGNCPVNWAIEAPGLRWIQSVSSGMDAYKSLKGSGIRLSSAKGLHTKPIAHHIVMMMLAMTHGLPVHLHNQKRSAWVRNPDMITSLEGQKVAIIGYGGIGEQLAPVLKVLGMNVTGLKRNPLTGNGFDHTEILGMDKLDEVLADSDHIVVCLPFYRQTTNFFDEKRLRRIKRGAYLYNVSRGEVIEEKALEDLLNQHHLAGAALDVFGQEPLPETHPFWSMPNVIITPHIAGHYDGLRDKTFELFCENFERLVNGRALINEVEVNGFE